MRDVLKNCFPSQTVFLVFFSFAAVFGQSTGDLNGDVRDSSEAVVAGAALTLENEDTGVVRRSTTDSHGRYQFSLLPIGSYRLRAEKARFAPSSCSGIQIRVASAVTLDFTLSPAPVSERIEVTAEAPHETRETTRGTTIDGPLLHSLPINGRDYGRFSLLTPGALPRGNQIADLTFHGLQTVHNQFVIDGIDAGRVDVPYMANGYERGARLLTGSLESIAEFRVQTSAYEARHGRAAGAYISIATRGGTNSMHGTFFHLFRNSALDARNAFNSEPDPKAPFRFNNFGAFFSGPLRNNYSFFSLNYEGARPRIGATTSGTVPSARLRERALAASPALDPILSIMPAGTSPTSNPLVDNYSTTRSLAVREDTGSVRLDHYFGPRDTMFARFNLNDSRVSGPLFTSASGGFGLFDRQHVPIRTTNAAVSHQHVAAAGVIHVLTAGVQRWESFSDTNGSGVPLVLVSGLTIRPGDRGAGLSNHTSYQLGSALTLSDGAHTPKLGVTIRNIRLVRRVSPFSFLTFASLNDFAANSVVSATVGAGDPGSEVRAWQAGAYAQDTWRPHPRVAFDFGLRYDYGTPPFDPTGRGRPFDPGTGRLAAAGTAYFNPNHLNFSPRLGVAWQPRGPLVMRAGYGIFFQAYPPGLGVAVADNTLPGNTTLVRQEIPNLSFPLDAFLARGAGAMPSASGFTTSKPDSYAQHWSFALGLRLSESESLEAAYVGNRGVHLRRPMNMNLFDPALDRRPIPGFANVNIETATGNSTYNGLHLSWTRRGRQGLHAIAAYAFSHAIDDVSDQGLFAATPQNHRNLRAERGNSSQDARHIASFGLVYDLPFRGRDGSTTALNLWRSLVFGWSISAVGLMRSGVATTIRLGTNTSGDGNFVNQRPDAVSGASPYPAQKTRDQWLNPAAFSVPAAGTFGNLARNTVYGPGLAQLDSAIFRSFPLSETWKLQARVEVFNVLNHSNLAQPNTTVGDPAFGRIFETLGRTLGMGTARQIQFSLRISF